MTSNVSSSVVVVVASSPHLDRAVYVCVFLFCILHSAFRFGCPKKACGFQEMPTKSRLDSVNVKGDIRLYFCPKKMNTFYLKEY